MKSKPPRLFCWYFYSIVRGLTYRGTSTKLKRKFWHAMSNCFWWIKEKRCGLRSLNRRRITIGSNWLRAAVTVLACARPAPVRLRAFCFAGGPAPRARSSSKRYTDDVRGPLKELLAQAPGRAVAVYSCILMDETIVHVVSNQVREVDYEKVDDDYFYCSMAGRRIILHGQSIQLCSQIQPAFLRRNCCT